MREWNLQKKPPETKVVEPGNGPGEFPWSCYTWALMSKLLCCDRLVSFDIKMIPELWLMSAHVANDQKIATLHSLRLKGWPLRVPWPLKAVWAITNSEVS